ncbi:MAG: SLATT domain-containing protein [Candidatus Brocadiales bacterium]|nr:SLATT domain-containing protein [Candidatus Bathyanammoxibius sp.]
MSILKDRIWITCKTRMFSEKRYRWYDLASHFFLTYMSLLIIVAFVFSNELVLAVPHFDKITITLALFVFTTSLIIYGFRFSEMANKHRDCYLKLQHLERTFDQQSDPEAAYQEILSCYPNHEQRDYEDLVLDRTFFGKRGLKIGEERIKWTYWLLLKKAIRFVVFWFLILAPPLSVSTFFLLPFLSDLSGTQ